MLAISIEQLLNCNRSWGTRKSGPPDWMKLESYHQKQATLNPWNGYMRVVQLPWILGIYIENNTNDSWLFKCKQRKQTFTFFCWNPGCFFGFFFCSQEVSDLCLLWRWTRGDRPPGRCKRQSPSSFTYHDQTKHRESHNQMYFGQTITTGTTVTIKKMQWDPAGRLSFVFVWLQQLNT